MTPESTESLHALQLIQIAVGVNVLFNIIGGIVIAAMIWFVWYYIWPQIKKIHPIGTKIISIDDRISIIETKFSPNGGSSLDDVIRQIKKNVVEHDLRLSKIFTAVSVADQRNWMIASTTDRGIYEYDTSGNCIRVNRYLADMFGMDQNDMLGAGWLRAVNQSERNGVWESLQTSIKNKTPFSAEFTVHNQRTHERFRVHSEIAILLKADEVTGYMGVIDRIKSPCPKTTNFDDCSNPRRSRHPKTT
jgi:PAS domain S-box-containing protein